MYRASHRLPSGKRIIVYHTSWAGYDRNFQVHDLPIDFITDINYAFFKLEKVNESDEGYTPMTTDPWADFDKRFTEKGVLPLDNWQTNDGVYGNFGQFLKLKRQGKRFNFGISIGGWSMSKNFSPAMETHQRRLFLVEKIIQFCQRYPELIDRIDIDWEYISPPNTNYGDPANIVGPNDAQNFAYFIELLRQALDHHRFNNIEITACIAGDTAKMNILPLQAMCMYLDSINVMTYDFASSEWGPTHASHQTNLFSTPYAEKSVHKSVQYLISHGVPPQKIVIGVPFYSRGFANCSGLNTLSQGTVFDKSWENGVCDYKTLPRPGAVEYFDEQAKACFSFDSAKRILNSYDNVRSVQEKIDYVYQMNLQGIIS